LQSGLFSIEVTEVGFGTRLGHSVAQVEYVKTDIILPRWLPGRNPNLAHKGGSAMANQKSGTRQNARNAKDGRYVTLEYAQKHPSTTVVEKDRKKK